MGYPPQGAGAGGLPDAFWLEAHYRLRPASLRNLRGCLARYLKWLDEQGLCWRSASTDDLRRYLGQLVDRHLAYRTLVVYRWALSELYRWAQQTGEIEDDPMAGLAPMRKQPVNLRWVPTPAQIERILQAPDVDTALGVRDRCVLELLYATGLRAAELVSLQAWQADPKSRHFIVTGKGGNWRMVIFGQTAADWLERYLRESRPVLIVQVIGTDGKRKGQESPHLFVHPTPGLKMNYTNLWRMVRHYGRACDLPLISPHAFRHAFATHCKDRGMDLITLQMLLGHASVTTTTIYLHTSMTQLKEIVERHHPRGANFESFVRRGLRGQK